MTWKTLNFLLLLPNVIFGRVASTNIVCDINIWKYLLLLGCDLVKITLNASNWSAVEISQVAFFKGLRLERVAVGRSWRRSENVF